MHIGIIDGSFPQAKPFGFRNREINSLLALNPHTVAFAPSLMYPRKEAFFGHAYGMTKNDFLHRKTAYLKHYPENNDQIKYLEDNYEEPFLAFSYFLADTYTYLPFIEKNKLPFCFVLYPGGGFGINHPESDAMLKKIFTSPFFRKVIVTSDITNTYLHDTGLCDTRKIQMLWCGVPQFESQEFSNKSRFVEAKEKMDVLFVANKYSRKGYDKGYDVYIKTARQLAGQRKITFHVVGDFSPSDIPLDGIEDHIIFHGILPSDKLKELYKTIDIQVGLSRSNVLFDGSFDGFPLGFEAMRAGALLITSDELEQNGGRFAPDELCVIPVNSTALTNKIKYLYDHPWELKDIAKKGTIAIDRILNTQKRVERLNQILVNEAAND